MRGVLSTQRSREQWHKTQRRLLSALSVSSTVRNSWPVQWDSPTVTYSVSALECCYYSQPGGVTGDWFQWNIQLWVNIQSAQSRADTVNTKMSVTFCWSGFHIHISHSRKLGILVAGIPCLLKTLTGAQSSWHMVDDGESIFTVIIVNLFIIYNLALL